MQPTRPALQRTVLFTLLFAAVAAVLMSGLASLGPERSADSVSNWTENLPIEQWQEVATSGSGRPVFRWTHSGAEYVPGRNSLMLFGADTHLVSFDNSVRELRLDDLVWVRHQPASPPYSMRTDSSGRRRAGAAQLSPWPMHVYDAMVYDPGDKLLRVFSGAKHSFVAAPGEQFDPAWAYDPAARSWQMSPQLQAGAPNFFANAAVYNPARDTIMAYAASLDASPFVPLGGEDEVLRQGLWELGPERRSWRLVNAETHHWGWFNAEFDQQADALLVFGGRAGEAGDGALWVYQPGPEAGGDGAWQQRKPGGDRCPGGNYFPAAYDSLRGLTLLLPPDRDLGRSVSCLYDFAQNTYRRLPEADLPLLGLNFTMIYASDVDLFVLIGGGFFSNEPTRVWVMKPAAIND